MVKIKINVFPHRFQQCLVPVNTLTIERSTQRGPFRHLSNRVFCSQECREYLSSQADLIF